jgi:hypothetical protein
MLIGLPEYHTIDKSSANVMGCIAWLLHGARFYLAISGVQEGLAIEGGQKS